MVTITRSLTARSRVERDAQTSVIISAAIEVHRQLGPGLLEATYEACLCFELEQAGIQCAQEVPLPVVYKQIRLDCGYRIDITVEDDILLEIKSVERLMPIHEAQMLTYLRLSGRRIGLLMNFNATRLKDGLRRFIF